MLCKLCCKLLRSSLGTSLSVHSSIRLPLSIVYRNVASLSSSPNHPSPSSSVDSTAPGQSSTGKSDSDSSSPSSSVDKLNSDIDEGSLDSEHVPAALAVDKYHFFQKLHQQPQHDPKNKYLRVSIIGAPNAGKSVLTNALVGSEVCAASKKVHTTRQITKAILIHGQTQIAFLDTPGVISPEKKSKHRLEESLLVDPENSLTHVDHMVVVVDVGDMRRTRLDPEILHMLYRSQPLPAVLVLNKVDLLSNKSQLLNLTYTLTKGVVGGIPIKRKVHRLLAEGTETDKIARILNNVWDTENDSGPDAELGCLQQGETDGSSAAVPEREEIDMEHLKRLITSPMHKVPRSEMRKVFREERGWAYFDAVFMVSALEGEGIPELKQYLVGKAQLSAWRFSESIVTDQSPTTLCMNLVRAKLLDNLPKQIPYQLKLKMAVWEVNEHDTLCIKVDILCPKDNIVKMVIGPTGQKVLGMASLVSQQLRNIFQRDVYLKLEAMVDRHSKKNKKRK